LNISRTFTTCNEYAIDEEIQQQMQQNKKKNKKTTTTKTICNTKAKEKNSKTVKQRPLDNSTITMKLQLID
jgi:hypothetical protein